METSHLREIRGHYLRTGLDKHCHQTKELDKLLPWQFLVGGRNRMDGVPGELAVGLVPVALSYYSRQRDYETAAVFLAEDREGLRTGLKLVGYGLMGTRRCSVEVRRKVCGRQLLHRGVLEMCYLRLWP